MIDMGQIIVNTGNRLPGSMRDGEFRGRVIEYLIVYYNKLVTWSLLCYTVYIFSPFESIHETSRLKTLAFHA
jgi:hypothetical protein